MLEKFAARLDVWLKEDPAYVEPEVDEVEPEVVKAPGRKRALFSERTNGLLVNIPLVFFASKLIWKYLLNIGVTLCSLENPLVFT